MIQCDATHRKINMT